MVERIYFFLFFDKAQIFTKMLNILNYHILQYITYPVLRMAGWTLYSLANTNGTIPCGSAAYSISINQ
jgi:hypothetical protein